MRLARQRAQDHERTRGALVERAAAATGAGRRHARTGSARGAPRVRRSPRRRRRLAPAARGIAVRNSSGPSRAHSASSRRVTTSPSNARTAASRSAVSEPLGGRGGRRTGEERSRLEQRAQVGIRRRHHLAGAVSPGERLRDPSEARHAAHRIEPMSRWLALRHGVAVPPLPRPQRLDRNRRRTRERADREHPAGGPHVVRSVCALSGSGLDQWTNHLGLRARTYKTRSGVVSRFRFSHHRFVFLSEPYEPRLHCVNILHRS